MQQGEREGVGCGKSCQCFLCPQCASCPGCSRKVGWSFTGGTSTMVVPRHQLCPRPSCAWAMGFLMIQHQFISSLMADPTQGGSPSLERLHQHRHSSFSLSRGPSARQRGHQPGPEAARQAPPPAAHLCRRPFLPQDGSSPRG